MPSGVVENVGYQNVAGSVDTRFSPAVNMAQKNVEIPSPVVTMVQRKVEIGSFEISDCGHVLSVYCHRLAMG